MAHHADTSFLASLYVQDAFSSRAHAWLTAQQTALPLTGFGRTELHNAIARLMFTGALTAPEGSAAWQTVETDLQQSRLRATVLSWDDVFVRADQLTARHTAQLGTRTLDILHVAAALELGAREFVSFDTRQADLAQAAGLVWCLP